MDELIRAWRGPEPEMRSIGNYGVSDSAAFRPVQTQPVRVAPDDCIVRCKGAGGYAQKFDRVLCMPQGRSSH